MVLVRTRGPPPSLTVRSVLISTFDVSALEANPTNVAAESTGGAGSGEATVVDRLATGVAVVIELAAELPAALTAVTRTECSVLLTRPVIVVVVAVRPVTLVHDVASFGVVEYSTV